MDFGKLEKSNKINLVPSTNYNNSLDVIKTLADINFNPRDFNVSKSMNSFLVSANNNLRTKWNRKINFDFIANDTGITVYGGSIRFHGKRVVGIAEKDITITGGTETSPSFVYVNVQLATWTGDIQYSLIEPTSNNTEINIPLHAFAAVSDGIGGYDVTYLYTCYFGDVQFASVIKD